MYNVIIIEDDPMVASINRQYVELNKYLKVAGHFSNGQEALEYLHDHSADLAILDVYMPVMDGVELLTEIRKLQKQTDVIMVTAASDAAHVKQLLSLGVIDYLVKPFEYVRFNHALARFMEHQELLNQENFSQQQLDSLFESPAFSSPQQDVLRKGLQEKTLDTILNYMKLHRLEALTSEKIAEEVHLSRVTVRRYMNYLLDKKEIMSDIDYTTGGRPSIIYRYV
ncbi:response regulator [Clostridium sp. Marseille-P2415]|uniref:response regulator n=1 Tax=Clostridium sp. Marseille-P2415 TaxID=1805471 RepID=UPI0009887C0B|nr:response regulator [Clostridium sp. Marseille-P2415]